MNTIIECGTTRYFYSFVTSAHEFVPPPCPAPFACLLWNADATVLDEERALLSRLLLDAGCTYLVSGGIGCEAWHDAADQAFINLDLTGAEYDRRFIMTSWHTDESFEDVAFFLAQCAAPTAEAGVDQYPCYLVIQYGGDFAIREQLFDAVRKAAQEQEDDDDQVA